MEVFDDKTETNEHEHAKEKAEDIFEDRKLFNDWYERELLKKSRVQARSQVRACCRNFQYRALSGKLKKIEYIL